MVNWMKKNSVSRSKINEKIQILMIVPLEYEYTQDARKASHKDREFERAIQRERSEKIKNKISQQRSERRQNLREERNVRAEAARREQEAEAKRLAELENMDIDKNTAFARSEENIEHVPTREQKMKAAFDLKSAFLEYGGDENSGVRTIRKTRKRKKNEGRYTGQTRVLTGKWTFKEYNNENVSREKYIDVRKKKNSRVFCPLTHLKRTSHYRFALECQVKDESGDGAP